ncbi:hypothetical protein ACFPL7_03355 [Dongia soli]|uniref:Transposase n=1 Tax=Dongia soli TaxID=600628 RepID=A0ABU5EGX2_9PROT|nr:hypothetical protein [Dongia soli]MDY0884673.1 hypothetical protein [Dongia soli]
MATDEGGSYQAIDITGTAPGFKPEGDKRAWQLTRCDERHRWARAFRQSASGTDRR